MGIVNPYLYIARNRLPWRINPSPVLVLGNQKSGTSAIAGLLGSATGLRTTIDIRGIYEPVQRQLFQRELSFDRFVAMNRFDFSKDIIKEPCLTLFVKEIDQYFDSPKYVFVIRDPRQNIRSILNRVGLRGYESQFDAQRLSRTMVNWPGWHRVLDNSWLGIPYSDYVSSLAGRWNMMAEIFIANRDRFILARYEDFVEDKVEFITWLAREIGQDVRADISGMADKQFQPRGNRSVSAMEFFGKNNLDRIHSICGNLMARFGYC